MRTPRHVPFVVFLVGVVTITLALAAPSGAAARASKKPVTFNKAMSCTAKGDLVASPALTDTGTKKATMTIHLTLSKCGGKKGRTEHKVTVKSGTLTGTIKVAHNQCTALLEDIPALHATARFTGKGGKIAPATITYSGGVADPEISPVTMTFPEPKGMVSDRGSFKGRKGSITLKLAESTTEMEGACQTGLSEVKFSSGTAIFG